jgi:hypothetical protein
MLHLTAKHESCFLSSGNQLRFPQRAMAMSLLNASMQNLSDQYLTSPHLSPDGTDSGGSQASTRAMNKCA